MTPVCGLLQRKGQPEMDQDWDADVEVQASDGGLFVAVLVLTPPAAMGPPVRVPLEGEYDTQDLAELAALEAFAAMSRSG